MAFLQVVTEDRPSLSRRVAAVDLARVISVSCSSPLKTMRRRSKYNQNVASDIVAGGILRHFYLHHLLSHCSLILRVQGRWLGVNFMCSDHACLFLCECVFVCVCGCDVRRVDLKSQN